MAKPAADPSQFEEAVTHFRNRVPLIDQEYRELDFRARRRAFSVANVAQLDLITQVWQALDSALANGTTLQDFKASVGEGLSAAWGGEKPWLVETIFRTNLQTAYGAGRWRQMRDPAVMAARPYWRFNAILDGRETEICHALAGTTLPADDPFWATHNPPLHFNCRSGVMSLTNAQAAAAGVTDGAPDTDAAEGFGEAPEDQDWSPDLASYPPALAEIFRNKTQ